MSSSVLRRKSLSGGDCAADKGYPRYRWKLIIEMTRHSETAYVKGGERLRFISRGDGREVILSDAFKESDVAGGLPVCKDRRRSSMRHTPHIFWRSWESCAVDCNALLLGSSCSCKS